MEAKVVIANKAGIHARPASMLVQTATKFQSKIKLAAKGKSIDAKSILMIMSLGLVKGTEVVISADGADADAAVKALKDLVESKFGEE
jgi:phosphocarrier protein